jgi:DNA invertase Pin-like site-specific DNA recombinase
MSKRAAIYTRISDDKERHARNVATQEEDCRALAEREGLTVVEVYSDNDISASTNSRKPRPGWNAMLDDAEAGRFNVILAYTTSRLTRRGTEREELIALHDEYGTQLRFVSSPDPDLSTADGRQIFTVLGSSDTAEAERTSERVRRKQLALAEAGRHNGPRPFGWDIHGTGAEQRLTINEAEAAVLRECVQRVLAGEGIWKITRDLNDRGIPTSTGKPWASQVLRRVLLRDRNYGYRKHQPRKRGKPHGEPRLYKGQWEPIIDRETHDRVVALLTDPTRRSNNRGTAPKYLGTSLFMCGECCGYVVGVNEYTHQKTGRVYPHSYKCPHAGCMKVNRRMADVDAYVEGLVVAVLERDGVRLLGGDPVTATAARERVAALRAQLDLAIDRFADGTWTDDQVTRLNARVRPQLDAELTRLRNAQPASGELDEFAGPSARDAWSTAPVEVRKKVIRLIGLEVTILRVGPGNGREFDPDSVRLTWQTPEAD